MKKLIIAIDGPAAAGKSSVAKLVAQALHYDYIDTGAMYRAITLKALNQGVLVNDQTALVSLLEHTKIEFKGDQQVFIDGVDQTKQIRSELVTKHVSEVSAHKQVRINMVEQQRELMKQGGVVVDGRDIGTYVYPSADLKIYQTASVEARAYRRYSENLEKGSKTKLQEVIDDINRRDHYDSSREFAPLMKAQDAIEIDTSNMTMTENVNIIVKLAREKM